MWKRGKLSCGDSGAPVVPFFNLEPQPDTPSTPKNQKDLTTQIMGTGSLVLLLLLSGLRLSSPFCAGVMPPPQAHGFRSDGANGSPDAILGRLRTCGGGLGCAPPCSKADSADHAIVQHIQKYTLKYQCASACGVLVRVTQS